MTLRAAEVTAMRTAAEATFNDTCVLQTFVSGAQDAVGAAAISYTDGSATACGFEAKSGRETPRADLTVAVSVAVVRLPVATVVDVRSRVKVTHRQGVALGTPLVFGIIAQRRGLTAVRLDLEAVAT